MKHNIEYRNFEATERINSLIESLIAKLDKRTRNFSPDVLFLRISIEGNQTRTLYHVSITMDVPGRTLATKEERHEPEASMKDAFAEIERQLQEHKSRLRGEHLWKRLSRRKEIRAMKATAESVEERTRGTFFSLVSPHLNKLYHLVRHIIRYSESMGELVRGELDPEDVTDATLVRAYREFLKGYPRQDIRSWLIGIAMDVLDTEINVRQQDRQQTVHIEEDIPETPPTEAVSTLGDEIMDFYQPDEDLKLEDIVPDLEVPTPEQITEAKELQRLLRSLLDQMPKEQRRALLLHDAAGRTEKEVASAIGNPEIEVERILDHAREFLRQKLTEAGYGFKRAA
jgi:RNA polymerase sigma factor (sigma-70 family)